MGVSVLISTYHGEDTSEVRDCLNSISAQIVKPDQVVIVKDGPLPEELDSVVDGWADAHRDISDVIQLEENRGTGEALQAGLENCTEDIVMKVDSDDVCRPDRLKKQQTFLEENPGITVVGSYMEETRPSGATTVRTVPTSPEEVREYARFRSPVNHPTAMFRRSAIEDVGGYRDLRSMQDYDLWMRLIKSGYEIANIPEPLVMSELSDKWIDRRGGLSYAQTEIELFVEFWRWGAISTGEMIVNVAGRSLVRLLPKSLRNKTYNKILRKQK